MFTDVQLKELGKFCWLGSFLISTANSGFNSKYRSKEYCFAENTFRRKKVFVSGTRSFK